MFKREKNHNIPVPFYLYDFFPLFSDDDSNNSQAAVEEKRRLLEHTFENWQEVTENFRATHSARLDHFKNSGGTIHNYFLLYPAYRQPTGHTLVSHSLHKQKVNFFSNRNQTIHVEDRFILLL